MRHLVPQMSACGAIVLYCPAMMEDEDGVGSTGFMEVVVDKILKQVGSHARRPGFALTSLSAAVGKELSCPGSLRD